VELVLSGDAIGSDEVPGPTATAQNK
jgi:hypothetical protein